MVWHESLWWTTLRNTCIILALVKYIWINLINIYEDPLRARNSFDHWKKGSSDIHQGKNLHFSTSIPSPWIVYSLHLSISLSENNPEAMLTLSQLMYEENFYNLRENSLFPSSEEETQDLHESYSWQMESCLRGKRNTEKQARYLDCKLVCESTCFLY